MSKIVKKKDLDVLIESTLEKAGIKIVKEVVVETKEETKEAIVETKEETKEVITESKKELINEELKRDLDMFNKLSNYTYKK